VVLDRGGLNNGRSESAGLVTTEKTIDIPAVVLMFGAGFGCSFNFAFPEQFTGDSVVLFSVQFDNVILAHCLLLPSSVVCPCM
jgi:hypothetical protein